MSEIDWSLAPEGATHGRKTYSGIDWYKIIDGDFFYLANSEHWDLAVTTMSMCEIRPAKKEWTGAGLPPVGTVCEFAGGAERPEDPFDKDLKEGMKVTIIAHFKSGDFTLAAFTFDPENPDRGMVQVEQGNFGCFRPIRTPEQIAAEEREKFISECGDFASVTSDWRDVFGMMFDAGYRRFEITDVSDPA
jgi:hypothetical protein